MAINDNDPQELMNEVIVTKHIKNATSPHFHQDRWNLLLGDEEEHPTRAAQLESTTLSNHTRQFQPVCSMPTNWVLELKSVLCAQLSGNKSCSAFAATSASEKRN